MYVHHALSELWHADVLVVVIGWVCVVTASGSQQSETTKRRYIPITMSCGTKECGSQSWWSYRGCCGLVVVVNVLCGVRRAAFVEKGQSLL